MFTKPQHLASWSDYCSQKGAEKQNSQLEKPENQSTALNHRQKKKREVHVAIFSRREMVVVCYYRKSEGVSDWIHIVCYCEVNRAPVNAISSTLQHLKIPVERQMYKNCKLLFYHVSNPFGRTLNVQKPLKHSFSKPCWPRDFVSLSEFSKTA